MERFLLQLTVFNLIITASRLLFLLFDQNNYVFQLMQLTDVTFFILFPLVILWNVLFLTIPLGMYYGVGGIIKKYNHYLLSTLTINSLACFAFIIMFLGDGFA